MVKERVFSEIEKGRVLNCYCTVAKSTLPSGKPLGFFAGLQCTCSKKGERPKRYNAVAIRAKPKRRR